MTLLYSWIFMQLVGTALIDKTLLVVNKDSRVYFWSQYLYFKDEKITETKAIY